MLYLEYKYNTRYSIKEKENTIYRVYGEDGIQYIVCIEEKKNKQHNPK